MKRALYWLIGFFSLTLVSFLDPRTLAQQSGASAIGSTVLTVEEEKINAATSGSDFKECASGCPVMIVVACRQIYYGLTRERGRAANPVRVLSMR